MDQLIKGRSAVGAGASGVAPAPELSVIVPAYNERDNVPLLVELLRRTLDGVAWEVIFVDDNSPDGTAAAVRAIGTTDDRVRCIRRIGRRGLAGACIEGILSSQARYVAILDADMQHDETLLAPMLERLRKGDVDVVVGSRYIPGGSADSFTSKRRFMSRLSHVAAHMITKVDLSDSGSGFFMIRRDAVEALAPRLSSQGFKLLLDIMTTARGTLRPAEMPYTFRQRQHGESKLDAAIVLDFAALLVAKLTNDAISFRFLMFCFVGLTGVVIHMIALWVAIHSAALRFEIAQVIATVIAVCWNFVLNNMLTYRDQRLTGWRLVTGLLRFQLICAFGAISNVGAAAWIYGFGESWWVAGLAGAVMSAVWNYVVSAAFVWRSR
ncbi:MAG: glycosyltransferase family 2 protein [Xanthobacteraceae bacterium]|nr:glycosyltransferase family 2 protein [Xanthobacteraceae bacterium]